MKLDIKELKKKAFEDFGGQKPLVAIEFGTSSLKVVVAQRNQDILEVQDFLVEDLSHIDPSGRFDVAKEKLTQFLKDKSISGAVTYLVVEDEGIFSMRISLPALSAKELAQAVSWEVKDKLPFPAEEAISDCHIINEIQKADGTKTLELLFIAIHTQTVNQSTALLEDLNFSLENVTIVPGSLLNILNHIPGFEMKEPIAVLEIGFNHIGISVFKEMKLIFTRRVAMGSRDITNALLGAVSTSKGVVRLSYADAEKIKQEFGVLTGGQHIEIHDSKIDSLRLASMMRPVLERMVAEIRNSFTYLADKLGESSISRIYLTGRGSLLKNLDTFFGQELGVPIEFLSLEKTVVLSPAIDPERKSQLPYLASTVGAMLEMKKGMDFLPAEFRRKKTQAVAWVALRLFSITAVLVLLVSNLYLSIAMMYYSKRSKYVHLNESTIQALTIIKDEIESMQNLIVSVAQGTASGSVLLKEIAMITPSEVSLESFNYDGSEAGRVQMKGLIYGHEKDASPVLAHYIKILENSPLLQTVTLTSSAESGAEDEPALNFDIAAKLELRR